jgi:hypothetical protein
MVFDGSNWRFQQPAAGLRRARRAKAHELLLLVLPLVVSIAFSLIADIDSPRGGVIRVRPQNLVSLAESLRAH